MVSYGKTKNFQKVRDGLRFNLILHKINNTGDCVKTLSIVVGNMCIA